MKQYSPYIFTVIAGVVVFFAARYSNRQHVKVHGRKTKKQLTIQWVNFFLTIVIICLFAKFYEPLVLISYIIVFGIFALSGMIGFPNITSNAKRPYSLYYFPILFGLIVAIIPVLMIT